MNNTGNTMGVIIPNMSGVFDWSFLWTVTQNFLASNAPFAMVIVAAFVAGIVLKIIIGGVMR